MFICDDCGLVFNEPKDYYEDQTPGGAMEGGSFIEHTTVCPRCNGTYQEAMPCAGCGDEYVAVTSESAFCESCYNKIEKKFNKLIRDNFRQDEWDALTYHLDELEPFNEEE